MSSSIHDKLNRVRKPRVHITYDVETEGAQIQRELPFVVGIMGDFSGDPTTPLKPTSWNNCGAAGRTMGSWARKVPPSRAPTAGRG